MFRQNNKIITKNDFCLQVQLVNKAKKSPMKGKQVAFIGLIHKISVVSFLEFSVCFSLNTDRFVDFFSDCCYF